MAYNNKNVLDLTNILHILFRLVVTLDELSPLVEPLMEEETDLSEMRSSLPSIGLFTDMLTTGQIKLKSMCQIVIKESLHCESLSA